MALLPLPRYGTSNRSSTAPLRFHVVAVPDDRIKTSWSVDAIDAFLIDMRVNARPSNCTVLLVSIKVASGIVARGASASYSRHLHSWRGPRLHRDMSADTGASASATVALIFSNLYVICIGSEAGRHPRILMLANPSAQLHRHLLRPGSLKYVLSSADTTFSASYPLISP